MNLDTPLRPEDRGYLTALVQSMKTVRMDSNRTLVVACYNESLDWLKFIGQHVEVVVYNKSAETYALPANVRQRISLPNVGRESHTYVWHIVHNYDRLADYTFFVQGNPLDRSYGLCTAVNFLEPFDFVEFGIDVLSTGPVTPVLTSFHELLFDRPCTEGWAFRACQYLGVSRASIHSRPVEFYAKLLNVLETGTKDIEAASVPYLVEQVWGKIFGGPTR